MFGDDWWAALHARKVILQSRVNESVRVGGGHPLPFARRQSLVPSEKISKTNNFHRRQFTRSPAGEKSAEYQTLSEVWKAKFQWHRYGRIVAAMPSRPGPPTAGPR